GALGRGAPVAHKEGDDRGDCHHPPRPILEAVHRVDVSHAEWGKSSQKKKADPPAEVAAINRDDEKRCQGAAWAKLDTFDRVYRGEIADGKYDRGEQDQPWYETREDSGRGPQQQKRPDQPADEAQNEQAYDAEFGDRQDIAAIRPCARKRSGKQRDYARCIRIDGIEPGKQQRRKCHQGSAAGERVQGSAEERGGDEDESSHELWYEWLVRGSQRVSLAR